MKRISPLHGLFGLLVGLAAVPAYGVITFELPDGTSVGATYPGVTFVNATALNDSLNNIDFPPISGTSVAMDDGGPISGVFSAPVTAVSFYTTYTVPITFSVYDAGALQIGQLTSLFSENFGTSVNPPNEFMQLVNAGGISSFKIEGAPGGNSFVIDDFSFTPGTQLPSVPDENAVPPLGLALLLASIIAAGRRFGRR